MLARATYKMEIHIRAIVVFVLLFGVLNINAKWQSDIQDPQLLKCIQKALDKQGVAPADLQVLKCHSKKIESLDGIAQFNNLTSLSLFNNRIERADLSGLQKLTLLNLAKNRLTELQVANLPDLHTLYAFQNKLEAVDLTGLNALQKLRLAQNKILSLNTQDLVSLESAHLFDNQMEDLDITPMVSLTFMDVKQNPMPDALYDFFDEQKGIVISHDGNADDWK